MGFDWCDVAAILNVEDNYIGTDGIRDIENLARIKGLVAHSARKLLVLNEDVPRCVAMAKEAEVERICYVTTAPDHNTVAKSHIASGGMAVTLRPEAGGPLIEFHNGGEITHVLPAFDVASTIAGKAMHNVHNAMFAVAVAHGLGSSYAHIRDGLIGLTGSHTDTPGRLDFFTGFAFRVILDYAHNVQEFRALSAVIKQLECLGRRIIALTSPGNRTDPHIDKLAAIAAQYSYDHYICYRRDDLRGRGPSEVPERLRDSLLAAGIAAQNISVVPVEEDTVNAALDMAGTGDLVTLLYTDHDRAWDMMKARLAGE